VTGYSCSVQILKYSTFRHRGLSFTGQFRKFESLAMLGVRTLLYLGWIDRWIDRIIGGDWDVEGEGLRTTQTVIGRNPYKNKNKNKNE